MFLLIVDEDHLVGQLILACIRLSDLTLMRIRHSFEPGKVDSLDGAHVDIRLVAGSLNLVSNSVLVVMVRQIYWSCGGRIWNG